MNESLLLLSGKPAHQDADSDWGPDQVVLDRGSKLLDIDTMLSVSGSVEGENAA